MLVGLVQSVEGYQKKLRKALPKRGRNPADYKHGLSVQPAALPHLELRTILTYIARLMTCLADFWLTRPLMA